MKRKIIYTISAVALAAVVIFCTRNPIGDRILAKACIFGQSKFGACQMAK